MTYIKNHVPWNKGLDKQTNTGKTHFKKGMVPWNKGKPSPQISVGKLGKKRPDMLGNAWSIGNKNRFKGGDIRYKKKQAKIRDNYTCQSCGLKNEKILEVDHLIPRAVRPDLFNFLENLITLCPNCHAVKTKKDRKWISFIKKNPHVGNYAIQI